MQGYSLQRLLWAGPLTTVSAAGANVIYYLASKALGEKYLIPLDQNGSQFAPMPVLVPLVGALIAGLLATFLFGALLRTARQPVTVFLSVAITAFILSLGGPFGIPAAALHTKLLMSGMNLVTAIILIAGILVFSREREPARKY